MDDETHIAPNMRTFRILELLGAADVPMTASEIHRALGLPKQTVHRLCNTMEEEGLLMRRPGGRGLVPGRRARIMASGILSTANAPIARHQILSEVSSATGETVNLVAAQDRGMYYVDRVETNWPIRAQLPIGTHVPFHCTASGKTFLSSHRPAERRRIVEALPLQPLTQKTLTDPDRLLDELDRISAQGYALDNEEFVDEMSAIAVPIKDNAGRFYAALAIHGPSSRFPAETAVANLDTLKLAATRLSGLMF